MAIGYFTNAAAFTAIIFGISPYFADNTGQSLISCYDDIIQACSHAEDPYCAYDRLETCDEQHAATTQISARLSENVTSRQKQAADLIDENHRTISAEQRSVRLIPLDEMWRSQGG